MKKTHVALGAAAIAIAVLAIRQAPLEAAEGGGGMTMAQMHQQHMPGMGQMPGGRPQGGDQGPASRAFIAANEKMHAAMAISYTGNADADFVRSMIPHHRGAIDMAKVVVTYGSDPKIRSLANGIIKAQEAEIAEMEAWLKQNAK